MKVTAFVDVLSHWCLAAWPAIEALSDPMQYGNGRLEIVLAPANGGAPMGVTHAMEVWYYRRGSLAYGENLRADWCEGPHIGTLHANAAVLAAARLGADLKSTVLAVMQGAMREGMPFGRAEEVAAFVARRTKLAPEALQAEMTSAEVAAQLREGNERLHAAGCAERPSFVIENDNGDRVTMQGVWQAAAVLGCVATLRSDEEAYTRAGQPV
jgi:2-hydroxychromene-2-carboxylate isomerase